MIPLLICCRCTRRVACLACKASHCSESSAKVCTGSEIPECEGTREETDPASEIGVLFCSEKLAFQVGASALLRAATFALAAASALCPVRLGVTALEEATESTGEKLLALEATGPWEVDGRTACEAYCSGVAGRLNASGVAARPLKREASEGSSAQRPTLLFDDS